VTVAPGATPRRPTRRRLAAAVATLAVGLAACTPTTQDLAGSGPDAMPDHPGCQTPEPTPVGDRGSFEDANLIAAGEMFRTYGHDPDPVREAVTGQFVTIGGIDAWKLDATIAATVDDTRRHDTWMLWIGFADGQLAVLCAQGPADVPWPPTGGG
jgi:hypothetical protein